MGGVTSTITNESIFRIPVPANIRCYVPEKTWQNQSRVTSLHWLVKIGGPLFVSRAKCMWKQINPFVTVLEQGRKVIDFYLIHSWFLDVKWGKSETQVDHIRPLHWGKTIKREHNTELHNYSHNTIHTYILNWPLPIGAFQGQCNTTKQRNRTTTIVNNPNWPEANQLAIYKCSWELKLNQGLPGTNSTSGQSGSWTRDLRISRQAP